MDRGKIVAIITGIISVLLAVIYLVIVEVLDFRGEMKPAPISQVEAVSMVPTFDGWGNEFLTHSPALMHGDSQRILRAGH